LQNNMIATVTCHSLQQPGGTLKEAENYVWNKNTNHKPISSF